MDSMQKGGLLAALTKDELYEAGLFMTEVFGEEYQRNQAIEEMAELTQALCKLNRPDVDHNIENVQEDLITVGQL